MTTDRSSFQVIRILIEVFGTWISALLAALAIGTAASLLDLITTGLMIDLSLGLATGIGLGSLQRKLLKLK